MEPANHNLTIYRDRDFSQSFIFKDDDGVVINLAGYSAKAQIRPVKNSSTLTLEFTTSIEDASGTVDISLTDSQTLGLSSDFTRGWWDLVLTNPSGLRQTYIQGSIVLEGTVTRA